MAAQPAYLASIEVRISPAGVAFHLPVGRWRFDAILIPE